MSLKLRFLSICFMLGLGFVGVPSDVAATAAVECDTYHNGDPNCPTLTWGEFYTGDCETDTLYRQQICEAACQEYYTPAGSSYCGSPGDECMDWCWRSMLVYSCGSICKD